MKRKKYPTIEFRVRKDKSGKPKEVLIDYNIYKSILDEMNELEQKIKKLQKKSLS